MAFEEDLTVFFNPADFAVQSIIERDDPDPDLTVNVIFDNPTISQVFPNIDARITAHAHSCLCVASELINVKKGNKILIEGTSYGIDKIELVDDGKLAILVLNHLTG